MRLEFRGTGREGRRTYGFKREELREYFNSVVHSHDLEMTARTMFAGGNRVPLALLA